MLNNGKHYTVFSYTKGKKYSMLILFHMKENNKQIMHMKSKGQIFSCCISFTEIELSNTSEHPDPQMLK